MLLYGFIYKRDCRAKIFNIYLSLSYITAPKSKEYIFQDILSHKKERVHHYVAFRDQVSSGIGQNETTPGWTIFRYVSGHQQLGAQPDRTASIRQA